jgi:DNA polymerase-3 subunit epsilon
MNKMNNIAAGNPAGGDKTVCIAGPHKIQRPARERADWPPVPPEQATGLRQICLIDTETTGLDWQRHKLIEICAAIVQVNALGRIVGIQSIGSALEDPGKPLLTAIVALTGLTDEILKDQGINREKLTQIIASCEGVIAFNSQFDRSFVEALLPDLPPMAWGCAMKDVPWRDLGFEPGPQNYLLQQSGYYPPAAHRAEADVLSLCQLLDHVCVDGQSVMAKLLDAMAAPAWRLEATWATYHQKDLLRERRYRWRSEGQRGIWHKHIREREYQAEWDWHVTVTGHEPSVVPLPATERYRHDRSWKPVERQAKVTA